MIQAWRPSQPPHLHWTEPIEVQAVDIEPEPVEPVESIEAVAPTDPPPEPLGRVLTEVGTAFLVGLPTALGGCYVGAEVGTMIANHVVGPGPGPGAGAVIGYIVYKLLYGTIGLLGGGIIGMTLGGLGGGLLGFKGGQALYDRITGYQEP